MSEKLQIPQHVAVIMDGNRRWAKKRRLSTYEGHLAGTDRIEPMVDHAKKMGIESISMWAFSTDNWKRSEKEVNALMAVFHEVLFGPIVDKLIDKGGKINPMGDLSRFSQDLQEDFQAAVERSEENKGITINIGLNYGGREEIVFAANKAAEQAQREGRSITEADISANVYAAGQPEVDLLIRTSGEQRLSGFMPWQTKNAELYFTDTNWPDFDTQEFDKALASYARRTRRLGK